MLMIILQRKMCVTLLHLSIVFYAFIHGPSTGSSAPVKLSYSSVAGHHHHTVLIIVLNTLQYYAAYAAIGLDHRRDRCVCVYMRICVKLFTC